MSQAKNSGADPTTASLDQIRNILVGDQERATQKRFKDIEDRMARDLATLRKTLEKKSAEMAAEYDAELEGIAAELEAASATGAQTNKAQAQKVVDVQKHLDAKIAKLSERVTRLTKQQSEDLKTRLAALREELVGRLDELSEEVETGFEELRASSVDKDELSSFFAEFALKLTGRKQIRLNQ
jgi:DNA anti-recombination protein RmuC